MADGFGETIRERVRQGILDGVSSIPSTDVLRGTQRTVTSTAADLLRGGLAALLGDDEPKS